MNCRHFDEERKREGRGGEWGEGSRKWHTHTYIYVCVCVGVGVGVCRLVMQLPGIKRHVRIED